MGADVDNFVVETDYDEYAMLYLLSTQKASGYITQIVKLYSKRQRLDSIQHAHRLFAPKGSGCTKNCWNLI